MARDTRSSGPEKATTSTSDTCREEKKRCARTSMKPHRPNRSHRKERARRERLVGQDKAKGERRKMEAGQEREKKEKEEKRKRSSARHLRWTRPQTFSRNRAECLRAAGHHRRSPASFKRHGVDIRTSALWLSKRERDRTKRDRRLAKDRDDEQAILDRNRLRPQSSGGRLLARFSPPFAEAFGENPVRHPRFRRPKASRRTQDHACGARRASALAMVECSASNDKLRMPNEIEAKRSRKQSTKSRRP